MLHEIDAQHPFQANRPAPCTMRVGVVRLRSLAQVFLADNLAHLLQKSFLTGLLAVLLKSAAEGTLAHGGLSE